MRLTTYRITRKKNTAKRESIESYNNARRVSSNGGRFVIAASIELMAIEIGWSGWTRRERQELRGIYEQNQEWTYISTWHIYVSKRNRKKNLLRLNVVSRAVDRSYIETKFILQPKEHYIYMAYSDCALIVGAKLQAKWFLECRAIYIATIECALDGYWVSVPFVSPFVCKSNLMCVVVS